jgi:GT2 family glycosyltransferase
MKLSVVIINYHSQELIANCLDSLLHHHSNLYYEVLIVNNGGEVSALEARNTEQLKVIGATNNIGFSRANNLGLKHVAGEFVLFLNADTLFTESILEACLEQLANPEVGALSCKLVYPDNTRQFNFHRGHRLFRKLWMRNPFALKWCDAADKLALEQQQLIQKHEKSHFTDWVSGAFLMMRRKDILEHNWYWDEDFFMYWEDVELCHRIRQSGKQVLYYADKQIVHIGGGGEMGFNTKRFSMMEQSKLLYLQKTRGVFLKFIYIQLMKWNLRLENLLNRRKNINPSEQLRMESEFYLKKH